MFKTISVLRHHRLVLIFILTLFNNILIFVFLLGAVYNVLNQLLLLFWERGWLQIHFDIQIFCAEYSWNWTVFTRRWHLIAILINSIGTTLISATIHSWLIYASFKKRISSGKQLQLLVSFLSASSYQFVKVLLGMRSCLSTTPRAYMFMHFIPILAE